ncbi:mucin-2-like [Engraulis encrasicolus]|uniref:mucin-2-like n=1 Tax=Engraulis encrasicolus TaxID=184585 RepID=UPI002FD184FE
MSEYNTSADQEFRALIRHMYNYLRACYHLSFTDATLDKKPRSLIRTTSILENQVKPALPCKPTNDLIKGNAQNWLGISLQILQNHYLDIQENSQIYILTASLDRWEEAWSIATKWIKKRYKTIEQLTISEAGSHITEIITHHLNTSLGTPSTRDVLTTSSHSKTGAPVPSSKDMAYTDPQEGTSHLFNTTNTHRPTVPPLLNRDQVSPTTSITTTPPPDKKASLQPLESLSTLPFAIEKPPLPPRTPKLKITLASPISKHTTIFQLPDTPTPPTTVIPETQTPPEDKSDPSQTDSPPLTLGSDFTPLTPLAKTSTPLTGGTEQTSPLDLSKDSPILTTAAGLSIPMLSLFKFHTQPDLIHWTPATGLEMSLHWKYALN